jgi:hypothetical protein
MKSIVIAIEFPTQWVCKMANYIHLKKKCQLEDWSEMFTWHRTHRQERQKYEKTSRKLTEGWMQWLTPVISASH